MSWLTGRKMSGWELVAFAFAAGTVISGVTATVMELATGRAADFAPPFVEPARIGRSLCAAFAAGPVMLLAHVLAAYRRGEMARFAFTAAAGGSILWAVALGVLAIELAWLATLPLPL